MDGTIFSTDLPVRSTQTGAECTQGIDYCAYKKMWGYGPLMLSLAHTCLPVRHRTQTGEPLYVVNRPASAPSHQGVAIWLDRALKLVGPHFEDIWFRGDTDFSLTVHFDRPACADGRQVGCTRCAVYLWLRCVENPNRQSQFAASRCLVLPSTSCIPGQNEASEKASKCLHFPIDCNKTRPGCR
jgi:hypothetical protein